ncbi:MAG: universal stress protein [Rhodocyclales bacterium]|nr:universal stress protein [Rhodocyclales bacterium]
MIKLNHLLAATDLSAPSRHAIDRGFRIAATTGASYSVMHAMELDAIDALREWLGDRLPEVKRQLEMQARESIAHLLADPARNQGVRANVAIVAGSPLSAITATAEELNTDMLILGMRGEDYLRHMLLGSTASRLLSKTSRQSILVVKQPPYAAYRRLLIPVDFSPVSVRSIRLARLLAPDADIVLLHAFEVPFEGKLSFAGVDDEVIGRYRVAARNEGMDHVRHLADTAGLEVGGYTPIVVRGDASLQAIIQEQELDCDLIVMGKHGKNATEELLIGSVTKHVLAESQCDVLIVLDK